MLKLHGEVREGKSLAAIINGVERRGAATTSGNRRGNPRNGNALEARPRTMQDDRLSRVQAMFTSKEGNSGVLAFSSLPLFGGGKLIKAEIRCVRGNRNFIKVHLQFETVTGHRRTLTR
jgi:hypothetical protein